MGLTAKQRLFVAEYLVDCNATRAAISAGYSRESGYSIGQENLKKPEIAEEIEKRLKRRLDKLDITSENVLRELAILGFSNMLDYIRTTDEGDAFINLSELTRTQAAAIQELTVEEYTEGRGENKRDIRKTRFKLGDKRGSLELLGKYLALFTEKVEHSGSVHHEFDDSRLNDEQLAQLEQLVESAQPRADQG